VTRRTALAAALAVAVMAAGIGAFAQGRRSFRWGGVNGNVEYDAKLTFARVRFDSGVAGFSRRGSNGEPPWAHDYPTSDIHLMKILNELTSASPHVDGSSVVTFDDPELFNYPIAYVSEPGMWLATDSEIEGVRTYLKKGGFLIFDDFRGDDWYNLEEQMKRALPDARWVALDHSHPIFNSFFEIKNFSFGQYGQETYYGIFQDNDPSKRLLCIAGHNQDLGEFWEFSDTGYLPIDLSNEAYKFGVNFYIYGLTH
jgi:hypothetical protein